MNNTLALDFCAIVIQCSRLAQALLILLVLDDLNVPDSARYSKRAEGVALPDERQL